MKLSELLLPDDPVDIFEPVYPLAVGAFGRVYKVLIRYTFVVRDIMSVISPSIIGMM